MFWKVISNYKRILAIIKKVADAAADKTLTETEVRGVMEEVLPLAKELGLLKE
jgi:hypothetical protein